MLIVTVIEGVVEPVGLVDELAVPVSDGDDETGDAA